MKSAKFIGGDRIIIEEVAAPRPAAGEVRIKVSYCGLCGSDKRLFHFGTQITPGHELTGVVIEVGAGVDLPVGTRAAAYNTLYCGRCKFCLAGETNRCVNMKGLVGWQTPGGYAEELVVPAANVIPLPDDISDAEGVLLLDTVGTAAYGVQTCGNCLSSAARSSPAAVLGCGPLGLGSLLSLQVLGWPYVAAYDPAETRQKVALSFGAEALRPEEGSNQGRFGLVVEVSGNHTARALAMDLVQPGGAVLFLGETDNPWTIVETPKMRRKDCFYVRTFYFPISAVDRNMDIFRARAAEFRRMIQDVVPLERLQETFTDFCAGKALKPLVGPNL